MGTANQPLLYRFTIIGAGASGLWLAHALLEHGLLENQTLCIVEADRKKENDRTWCYWAQKPIEPAEAISKQWARVHQHHASPEPKSLAPYHYYHIRSADFYSIVKDRLKACKNVSWIEEELLEYHEQESHVCLATYTHQWTSQQVFLSALPALSANIAPARNNNGHGLFLWQSFVGWRVKTATNAFEEDNMSMMDFSIAQNNQTQFMYELPFSKTEALVEMTRFGKEKLTVAEAEVELKKYFLDKGKGAYTIEEVETGAIPMTPQFDSRQRYLHPHTRTVLIGTLAGAIKPSTGFGFKRMNEYATALASAIKNNTALPTMYRPFRFRLYDELLLSILTETPQRGKEIFEQLFRRQPIQRILKFLDEKTSFYEELLIFIRLPIRLFLKSLLSRIFT